MYHLLKNLALDFKYNFDTLIMNIYIYYLTLFVYPCMYLFIYLLYVLCALMSLSMIIYLYS